ncbi:MAG TPA: methyltransferase domain-containing protein [Candidatus Ozemobacteraceae bacterium]
MNISTFLPEAARKWGRELLFRLLTRSLQKAAQEQGLWKLAERLASIVPDISDQYSQFRVDTEYLQLNVRLMHAFQIALVQEAFSRKEIRTIVDIGDSSGTHLRYLQDLYAGTSLRCLSVNLDPKAVEKIKGKGLEAILARAEDLPAYDIPADMFLCFETLEHLSDPIRFLHQLATHTNPEFLVATVPYRSVSRMGLHHIRNKQNDAVFAENTHLFELCPADWRLLMQHAGWQIAYDRIYYQYPHRHPLRMMRRIWETIDFEGFYGTVLVRNDRWSSLYRDW